MRDYDYIVRNGYVEQVWKVTINRDGFQPFVFIRGTEPEMLEYIRTDLPGSECYSACDTKEQEAIGALRAKVYIAPKL